MPARARQRELGLVPRLRIPTYSRPGAMSGFMNVTAGFGGPAIILYAVSTTWEHRRFLATFQAYTLVVTLASLLAKGGLPHVSSAELLMCLAGLALGLAAASSLPVVSTT